MSDKPSAGIGLTRIRDLLLVAVVAAVVGFLLVLLNYSRIPLLPRLAGVVAAILGIAEAIISFGLRSRSNARRDAEGRGAWDPATLPRPVAPLTAARIVAAAKASSLAGAAVAGLWIGLLVYVVPRSSDVAAANADTATGLIGVVGALVMIVGAYLLELACRTPSAGGPGQGGRDGRSGPISN